jgi:uncharacterized OsmC-like protein
MPTLTFSVSATGTGVRQDVDVVGSGHLIRSDAYADFGGQDAHPSPLAYLLASLSSCTQVTASVVAREQGIAIDSYAISVDGDFDPTVMVSGRETDAQHSDTFNAVRVDVALVTSATQAEVDRLAADVERRCPVSALFRRAGTPIATSWTVSERVSV